MTARKSRNSEDLGQKLQADCGTRDHYHHGNLRAALVEAGLEILEEEGIDALGLRSAARRAAARRASPSG